MDLDFKRGIDSAPKNGDALILQDESTRSWELGRWSFERNDWVRTDGRPLRIFPTHWIPGFYDGKELPLFEFGAPLAQASALVPTETAPRMLRADKTNALELSEISYVS